MPLITDERTAVELLLRQMQNGKREGLKQFARESLGAHSDQARRLVELASAVDSGISMDALPFRDAEPTVQVTREIDGRDLNLTLKADRLPITSYDELVEFYEIDTERWQPTQQLFNFWGSESNPNFQVRAAFKESTYHALADEDREDLRERLALLAPLELRDRDYGRHKIGNNMLEIMVSDLHIGRDAYPIETALRDLKDAVLDILLRSNAPLMERIFLVFNGDTFNDDNAARTTTGGTPQESAGWWQDTFRQTRDCLIELALTCADCAPTEVYVIEGNHDRERSYYLADVLHAYFHNDENVVVHTDTVRNYIDWGNVTIGLAHGDEMKPTDLAMTILRETDSQNKEVIEWHLGHIHTRREDEIHGVLLRRFRTPTVSDAWSFRKGFGHNVRSVTGMVWDKYRGEVATYPYTFTGVVDG